MYLLTSVLLLLVAVSATVASCPDFRFSCPSGEKFTVNTCFSKLQCYTCTDIETAIKKSSCMEYACGSSGTVEEWYNRNNGCSAPALGIKKVYIKVFRAACAIHDLCYATPGRTQKQCDDDFHYNMKQTCKFPGVNSVGSWLCYIAAKGGYKAVQKHGKSSFTGGQAFAQSCTKVQ